MEQENKQPKPPETCPKCGKKLEYFAIPTKEGRVWKFWGCPDRKNCGYIWRPPTKQELRHQELMNALKQIYAKLNLIEKEILGMQRKQEQISNKRSF